MEGVFHFINKYITDGTVIVPRNLDHATEPSWDEYLSRDGLTNTDWDNCAKFFRNEGYRVTDRSTHLIIEWVIDK